MTPTNTCLDAETLAAWLDGGLSRNDAAMAETHVSSCPRCQEIAGLIVKTMPATAADPPWWRRRAPWLVPAAAGVAAAGLLMIARTDPAPESRPPAAMSKLESAKAEPPNADSARAARPAAPPVAPPAETRKEQKREARANTAAGAAGTPAAAAPPAVASARVAEQGARQELARAGAKEAVSPDGALRWRITGRGTLERSADGGRTWEAVNVGITATFATVEAPEPRTAIVTAGDGRRFRTTDAGATWQSVPK